VGRTPVRQNQDFLIRATGFKKGISYCANAPNPRYYLAFNRVATPLPNRIAEAFCAQTLSPEFAHDRFRI
jgi:hypothetical protein